MEFPVSSEGIRAALDALLAQADAVGIARPVAHRMAVIVDEYCSNLIRHDDSITGDSRFGLHLEAIDKGGVITIRDDARPFDPTLDRPQEHREIGGQGIVIMKGLAKSLSYLSSQNANQFSATVLEDGQTREAPDASGTHL